LKNGNDQMMEVNSNTNKVDLLGTILLPKNMIVLKSKLP